MKTQRSASVAGISLVEMMFSVGATSILMGALILSSMSVQRAIHGSEAFSTRYGDQRRLIDYLSRELRRASTLQAESAGARLPIGTEAVMLTDSTSFVLSLPGYYRSNAVGDARYAEAMPVVQTESSVDYGDPNAAAPVEVAFRKAYLSSEGGLCYLREEAGHREVIVRNAKDLSLQVSLTPDGREARIKAWFVAPYTDTRTLVSTFDEVMLRNAPPGFRP